jgi:putative ATP-dependent endonuclease of OLD family
LATQSLAKESFESAENGIEHDWPRSKLNLVHGDLLLDIVCRRFGTRFEKVSDSAKLAALLSPSEIEHDLGSIIRELVR